MTKISSPVFSTRGMLYVGVLTALEIILSRFLSFSAWNLKIGLSFVPVVLAALLLGPLAAAIVGGLGDLLGAVLFPIGPYFPGFTLCAVCIGLVFGLFLFKKYTYPRVLLAVFINQAVFELLINSYWISVLYGSPYKALLLTRLAQCGIVIPVQLILLPFLQKLSETIKKTNRI